MKNVPAELQNVRLPSSRQAQNLNIIDILSAMNLWTTHRCQAVYRCF